MQGSEELEGDPSLVLRGRLCGEVSVPLNSAMLDSMQALFPDIMLARAPRPAAFSGIYYC